MRRLLAVSIVAAALVAVPRALTESTPAVTLTNPQPVPSYTPRVSRQRSRQSLTLTHLPAKWRRLAWCESRHRLHAVNNDTYYGLWQIHKGWYKPFGINPTTASIEQQWRVAQHVYNKQGAKAWTCSTKANFK